MKNWITLNEPSSYCYGGYVDGGLVPDRCPASSTPLNSSSSVLPTPNSPAEAHFFTGILLPRCQPTEPAPTANSPAEADFIMGISLTQRQATEPAPTENSPAEAHFFTGARNQLLAHAAAVTLYKDNFQV